MTAQKNQNFEIRMCDVEHVTLCFDSLLLNQILLNLLSNAVKFTPECGSIRVEVTEVSPRRGDRASFVFCVSDTGIGMQPAIRVLDSKDMEKEEQSADLSGIGEEMENEDKSLLAAILGQVAFAFEKYLLNEKKNAAAMQAESERFKANLLRAVSHDLRTPLTSISGSVSSLLSTNFDEKTRKELLQGIQDDSIWLINLVENLLSVSRLDSEEVNLKTEPQLLEELVSEALAHVSKAAKNHRVSVEIADPLLMAQVDATLVVQVLVNLIDNAVKYTPPGSCVHISAEKKGDMACVRVADNGPGIRDKDKGAIFDMFFTAGGKKGDNRRGLGLGLALCKS